MRQTLHEVIVYHDETGDAGSGHLKGHVLFWVPYKISGVHLTPLFGSEPFEYSPAELLYERLMQVRDKYDYDRKFHFVEISGARWSNMDVPVLEAMSLAVEALRHKFTKMFKLPICCKLAILFYSKKSDLSLYGGEPKKEKYQRHAETILRMLVKGSAHHLYDETNEVYVHNIVSDGFPSHRPLNPSRIIWQLFEEEGHRRKPLRDYVRFAPDGTIRQINSQHKEYERGTENYKHAHYLQLSDLLLGGVIHACHKGCRICNPPKLGEPIGSKRDVIATPIIRLLDKHMRGFGFRASGHFRSFTVSQVEFGEEGVIFRQLTPRKVKPFLGNFQQEFDFN